MTKKEICESKKPIAFYSISTNLGFEIYDIDFGINDYVIGITFSSEGKCKYHKLKIYESMDDNGELIPYVNLYKMKIYLNECIKL